MSIGGILMKSLLFNFWTIIIYT